ncbi:MAG: signal peptidase II [Bacilli bacterium]|nr:signal peptidase II [Bacilli bacterium]MBN2696167.1 signal peptidase II [Bacilli bacterium]
MLFWIFLILGLVAIDQLTKLWVVATFEYVGDSIPIIDGFFHFTYVRNPGAVFGIGANVGFALYFFIAVFIVAIGIFGYMFIKIDFKSRKHFYYIVSLSLLIAGSIGNTIDRIFQVDHKVVDFLAFPAIWDPVFNVADMCLTVGIIVFVIDQLFIEPKRSGKSET